MMLICRWHGEYKNCSDLFRSSKTDDGFCCSFNTVSLAEGFTKVDLDDSDSESESYDYDFYDNYAADYGMFDVGGASEGGSGEGSGGSVDYSYFDYQPANAGSEIAYDTW